MASMIAKDLRFINTLSTTKFARLIYPHGTVCNRDKNTSIVSHNGSSFQTCIITSLCSFSLMHIKILVNPDLPQVNYTMLMHSLHALSDGLRQIKPIWSYKIWATLQGYWLTSSPNFFATNSSSCPQLGGLDLLSEGNDLIHPRICWTSQYILLQEKIS